ncbi:UNVERIFIED_CONTAM: hypothetical protein K2H54_068704 [Gekko kuhli]
MERTISDFFSLLGDPRFLLGSALALVLLNYLLWELLHSHPVGERISRSLWGRHLQPPILPKILARLRPVAEWVNIILFGLAGPQRRSVVFVFASRAEAQLMGVSPLSLAGISMQLLPSTEKRVPRVHWHSIRQLLCDDSTCVICDRAAREASQYTGAVGRPSSRGSVDLNLGLPERKRHQRFKRSASAPAPTSVPLDLGPVRSVYCSPSLGPPGIKKDQSFPFEEPAAPDWDERSHSSSHQVGVQALASSSSTFAASHFTWGKSSSGSSEFSVGSLALSASSICRLQMSLAEQEYSQGSSWTERKASSEHQRGQWERPVPPKNSYSHSLLRTAPRSPAGASEGQAAEFTTADTPFLEDAAIASLESHVLVKRVQHHLGLPVTLLRSLRSFMLPAPDLTSRRRLREFGVVTRPQALPFLGSGTRKKLELHLNRMVRVKQWQLPQKIQGALGQMKPPWQSREKRPLSAVRKQGPGATGQVKGARRRQRTSAKLPTTAGVLDSKTNPASQAELQSHLVKKSLEIRLETFPAIVGHSQKMSSRSRVPRLPKSIPLGQSFPQLRNRLCLVLRSKADIVDMNIKCKYIHFLWGLPSLYMQSLSKMVPRAPAVPMSPTWMHATVEFVSMDPPFAEIRDLECHVLRKRLQHQWGLPGLVLQSVKQFLMPQLSLPARATSVLCSRLEVKILIGDTLFLLANVKEKLEAHVKTKIIERRWGLPRRALDSLRVFIPVPPPPAKRPRENEKTFALPQGEKPAKRKPSARTPRASRKQMVSSGKALQRHLTKKALEVRLGTIAPMAQRSWAAVRQGWKKHTLPKVIPPGFKPLVPRPQELLFMDLSNLGNLQLNIVHKGLVYRWGLLTVYNKSLARLFQDTGPPAAIALSPSKPTEPKFTAIPTPFISRRNREVLEWHVRRKNLQHTWGLPGLIQRSLRCLLPTAPSFRPQKGRHAEVAVSLTEPTFLSDAARRELERNVQKRILNQQWQLPRRVLASLRLLRPPWKADALGQKPRGFPFAQSKGSCPRKAGHPNHPAGSMKDALCTNCYMEELGAAAPQRSQAFPTLGSTNVGKMALHWTKKSVEVQLEVFPAVVKRSWKCTALTSGQRLPKLVPPGREPLQPRKCSLPFVSREDAGRMEVAVRLSHLASLWGLGTRYVEGLHAMIPSAAIQSLGRRRRVALEFFEGKVSFLDGPAREALELHVRKKRLQHEWGLPVLIHRSIKAFVQGSPLAPVFRKTMTHIQTLQQDLAFLPRGTCGRLEYHLQRLKLQRQWGLPRRVLKSLHSLVPETDSPPMGRMMKPSRRSLSTESGSRLHRRLGTKGAMDSDQGHKKAPERVDTALCPTCQGSALKGAAAEKLRQHLAKKSVEVHLEVLPAIARLSWRHASLSSKQPLPKLVPPGHRVLEPRQSSFPFLRAEEMDRVELALRCSRLASLWGLGTLYMEAIVAMVPRMPFHPVKSRRAAFGLPAGKPTFPGLDLATLEMHIKKKRLQHEWGLPSLALRSLGGFMQGAPARPHLSKTVIDPNVLPQALTFLPWATRSHLEFHVQRMKLQRAWGLPARILASLKAFVPSASFETSPFTLCYEEERSELVESSPGETQQPSWAGKMAKCFSSKHKAMENHLRKKYLESGSRLCGRSGTKGAMDSDQGHKEAPERVDAALCPTCQGSALNGVAAEKLRQHLAKKSVEVHLEVLPAVARLSWRRASLSSKQPLPKLVPPGHRVLEPRQSSFPFLRAEEMDRVELALRCSRLASLWGLGTRYTEVIVAMVPRMPFHPVKSRRAAFGLPTGKPNFPGLDLATLEMHVKKKRLQHEWGLPSLALRSLGGFMQGAPARPHRSKTVIDPYVLPQALTFLPRATRSCLEFHVQRMKLQRAWGLPVRILASLKVFVPSASFEMSPFTVRYKEERSELVESSPGETQQPSWAGKMTRCFSSKQKGMENHLRKKYLETRLEAFPTVVSWSQAAASGWEKTRLPKLVRAGQKHPRSRAGSLSFLLPATVDLLEVNVKHKHLAFLWGLPNLFMEPLSMFVLKGHPPVRVCREKIRFQEAKTPFCQKEAREGLEHHILKKRLHHHWGLPSVIQRSLRAWAPALSAYARPRQKISTEVNILVADIPFVPVPAQKKLETSLKKMIVHGRWGLPKRLQGYVRAFAPTPLADRELLITRPRQVTSVGLVSRQAPSQTLVPPILGLFRSSKIRTLENHLNKKSLEIKFQLPSVVTAPIEKARLPKRPPLSPVMKPRGAVLFVEPEALWKITLNIKRKYLTYLWGLPTLHTKSLKKMFGAVPEWSQKKTLVGKEAIWTGHGATRPGKWTGNSADFGSRSFPSFTVKPSFLMDEALDLLESHVRHKKLQHEWGLPATIQKSLRAFAPVPEEGRRGTQSSKQPARRPCCMTSHQQHETHSDREGEESPEILRVKRRMPEKRERMRQETQVVATRPGKKATTFASLELKPSFLPEEVLGLLAFHIQHKKVQHLWGRPSIVLKSMHAFAPFPHETEKNMKRTGKITMETHPWVRGEVQAVTPSLLFLSPDTTLHLEAHLSNMVAKHRWGLPALVQHSLKAFLPPPPSPPSKAAQPCKSVQVAAATGGHHEDSKREAMPGRRKTVDQESIGQKKRATGSSSPAGRLPFLTAEVQELLEFHVQRKKVQHMWGLPSAVLRSLHAFAPFPFETEKNMQHIGKITTETHPWVRGEVRVIMPSLLFMNPDKTLHLEAHLSNMVAKHRWGLPALVQHSLKAFLPPPPSPPSKAAQPCKSVQVAAATGGHHKDSKQEAVPGRKKTVDQESNHQKKRATASSSPAGRLPFLTAEVQELLEFHVQRKKVQHMWGLPSAVLRSLHAFAPFPFETEKKMQRTGKITTEMHPWVRGEVRVIKPSLMFLTPDATLHLEAHLSNMVAKHRWGLPALVQHSLKAFLLSPPSSPSEAAQGQPVSAQPGKSVQVAATGGGHREDSMREATPGRRKTGNRENIHQKKQATASSSPVGRLPFLTAEAQELLEFHMQRKKVQHLWGLPSIVLKSLRAFAPFPREPVTRARDATVTLSERRPWDTEVRVPVQSLLFLGADTKERLEAHVRSRTAEHRWGLPNLVQKSLQALLPPASLSHPGEVNKQPPLHRHSESPQAPVRRSQITTERSVRKLPSRGEIPKEQEKEKPVAASAVPRATSLRAKLPFLTDSNQDALEFHIQRKKIQHEWGLPLMVQRSVHAFAPVPPELHQGVPSTGGESAAVAGAKDTVGEMGVGTKKPWIPGTVNIDVPSLHFLGPDTKENLEAHLRNLTIEHRWGLPRLVHKSMRAFIPFPSHLDVTEMEDQERPSVYSYGKTVMASDAPFPTEATEEASSEDQRTYHSTPLEEMEQGGGTDSRPDTEEPLFYPGTKPEYAMAIQGESGGWKAGRESTQRSTLQKRPHLMKATQRQKSMLFGPKRNPSISSLSSSRPGPRKYRSSASSRSMNLPRARDSSTRIPSGRTPIPRSSKTAFRNGKGMSREVEFGFQRMAEGSHPRAGLKEPQAQDISSPGWELGSSQKGHAYPCACYLRAHKDDSGSSLPSDAEQRWGMAKGTEPDLSGYPVPQDTGFSSEESPATGSHQEPEFPSARIMPESADAAPQCHVPISKEAESSLVWPSTVVQPHALYEDTSAGPRRQASRMHREKTNSSLPMRGSRPGGNWEKKKVQPHLPRHQPPSRALRRRSSKDLCEACRGQKPPPHPKGAASRSRGSREFNQHRSPAPQNQGSLGKEGGLQGHPEHPLQAMMGDKATERKAEGVTVSPSKAPRPLSTGAGSQFSTECESERVGDWDTEEENAGRRNTLRKEEGGGTKRAGEMRRTETSTKAQGSPKRAASPAATQSQKASPKSVVLHKEGPTLVKTEKRRVLGPDSEGRRTVVRMQTVRVKGPEGGGSQGVRDEEEGVLHWRKGPSEKGRLPAKEALVRHGSRRPSRMPRGNGHLEREALKMVQEIGKGIWGGGQHAQFIQGVSAKDMHRKLSLLGTIVEKKLLLQQGFRVWVQNQEWEEGSRGRVQKSPGASRPPTSSATRVAQMSVVSGDCGA